MEKQQTTQPRASVPLSFVPQGAEVILNKFGDNISDSEKARMRNYGLSPKQKLTVLRQIPMTIIHSDELEIAIEAEVAREIWVVVS